MSRAESEYPRCGASFCGRRDEGPPPGAEDSRLILSHGSGSGVQHPDISCRQARPSREDPSLILLALTVAAVLRVPRLVDVSPQQAPVCLASSLRVLSRF